MTNTAFKDLGLSNIFPSYQEPTKIQSEVIPDVLNGSDVLASSQTGTGKTASFVLPTLDLILKISLNRALIKSQALREWLKA